MQDEYQKIRIADLTEDQEFQYRASDWRVDDLLPSLKREGQLFPVLVRPVGKKFQLVSGYRRVAGLKQLGQEYVQARILYGLPDAEARRIALAENLDRQSLTTWDQLSAAARLRSQGLTNAEVASDLRVTVRTVQRYLRVAEAPDDFRRALARDEITVQQAYEALKRGISLSELVGHGRSVRYLRGLSRKRETKESIRIQHRRGGEIVVNIRFDPGKTDLTQLLSEVKERLTK
jgi:ParB/RepB/Spo0J family partition protein